MYTTGSSVYPTGGFQVDQKEQVLNEVGLTKNESKVYVALTELGFTTITKVADKSKVHRVNVYDAVKKLKKKGLVNKVTRDDKVYYQSTDPSILLSVLKEKELSLQKIIPQLQLNQTLSTRSDVKLFEGPVALRNILNSFLEKGVERMTFGVPANASKIIGEYFLEAYHTKRNRKKIPLRHIYNVGAEHRAKFLKQFSDYTQVRFLPESFNSPVATNVCGDEVVFILYSENPICIVIKNEQLAEAYRNYYEILWKMAKEYH